MGSGSDEAVKAMRGPAIADEDLARIGKSREDSFMTVAHADMVNHPKHYGGEDNPYEAIKIIEAHNLGFNTGNSVKYILRCGHKPGVSPLEDLKKARWYLDREIKKMTT